MRNRRALLSNFYLLCILLSGLPRLGWSVEISDEHDYDRRNGEEINRICAACHGENGEGGGDGTYPRLAGFSADYLAKQLRDFKARKRLNIPMTPYTNDRELPEADVLDISIYLSGLKLDTIMPDLPEETSSYDRLLAAQRVFNVARLDGNLVEGQKTYKKNCQNCHGRKGWGRGKTPQLAGQYSVYLRKQFRLFSTGQRKHKLYDKFLGSLSPEELENLLAWLSTVDD